MTANKDWVDRHWFAPRELYAEGYPGGMSSSLRSLPSVRSYLRETIAKLAPRQSLEIGPGDAPLTSGLPGAVLLDVSPAFLGKLGGLRVRADLLAPPFAPATFDLVVMADVLTHFAPEARAAALASAIDLGGAILVFNSEWGATGIDGTKLPTQWIADQCAARGLKATRSEFTHHQHERKLVMGLVVAAAAPGGTIT